MSDNSDMMKLYSSRILALAADIPRLGRLNAPTGSVTKRSPLCGSQVTVDVVMQQGKITDFAHDVKACALGQAAAAITAAVVIGQTPDTIKTARDALWAMLCENGPTPAPPFEGLEVLKPAAAFKNRHASIMLSLDATLEACTTPTP